MTDKYAVIGHPIKHSKSPFIHAEFAKQCQQDIEYTAIEVPLDSLASSLQQLRDVLKLKGINITVPFKEQAWELADNLSDRAQRAGAINTLMFENNGSMFGDNTDGIGLCRDLENHDVSLKDKRVLLIGAGGAARGVIAPLMTYQPTELFIANRTASKAKKLAELFADLGQIQGGGFSEVNNHFDVIINATAASLQGEVPDLPASIFTEQSCCYDMMYANTDTAFIAWAKKHNVSKTVDGLGMLVEQAAEAFYLWRKIRPDTGSVMQKLRDDMQAS
ncbi:MAG TPA: shikimate dehydrogenase [Methylophaga aminisulfidivorans]|uniref:shikimate dehydrogenase n=1 Tax=Methylophaga TaxID=40222 RepID=UPI001775E671|nr:MULTISPECIES: shikimate dehydrogenase [Methylophaga]HIC46673.1 shikimate dehydrogenase [Methylophaga sp.]HIM39275.1 shikimate dehydrogenase [Methylophaga aminisulfidivorans]